MTTTPLSAVLLGLMLKILILHGYVAFVSTVLLVLFFSAHDTQAVLLTSPQELHHGAIYDFIIIGGMNMGTLGESITDIDSLHYRWRGR